MFGALLLVLDYMSGVDSSTGKPRGVSVHTRHRETLSLRTENQIAIRR